MSMFNDTDWTETGYSTECFSNSEKVKNYAKKFPLEKKTNGMECTIANLRVSGHPVLRVTSTLNREVLNRTCGRCTVHFNAESSNAELSFRTIHSANQLCIYGAVASWCGE